jgi:murein DD-endopeptidase MepM/ murein hydrolase activator NlpD
VAVAAATPSPQAAGVRTTELAPPPGVAVTPEPAARPAAAAEPSVAAAPADREARQDAARQRDLAAVPAPPLSGDGFLWPVDAGDLISAFGAKPDGRRNDGINIAAPAGTIVRAAENGLVVYADEDLAAFGRMLLIRHADGFLTAYAHNDALLVTRGDTVTRGQPIAKVGRSGEVVEPQLHFEIRRGKNAVDPVALLGDGDVRLAQRQ